ncbi:MAG: tRNA lysidine(34) synthetase TilS [Nitrospirota bacterium]
MNLENSELIDRVANAIKKYSMLSGGENVLAGLSGGPDSVCLLYLLNELKKKYNLRISAVYVDHNLRPDETPVEIEFCGNLCRKLGTNFIVKSVDVKSYAKEKGLNKQEAARELRYEAFQEAAFEAGADRIALAHNADDQTETFFMRLIRGAGPSGLTGIPVKRGAIIRPLIEIERSTIEDFLVKRNISYVVDSSNLRSDYFRNRLRLSFLPELKRLNPNLVRSLNRTISILQDEERYFDIVITKTLMKMISRKTANRIELFLAPMENMDIVVLRRVLRRAIDETEGLRGISFVHIEDIIRLVREGKSGDRIYLPKGIRVIKEYSLVIITSESPLRIGEYALNVPGEVAIRGAGIVLKAFFEEETGDRTGDGKSSVVLAADNMSFPLKIRPRNPGDFFYPFGFGKRKKIQDFFVDEKVPRDERDSVPLVVSGGEIVWIAGYRADERFRINDNTKKNIRLVILKGRF